jgi:hypothetical protein
MEIPPLKISPLKKYGTGTGRGSTDYHSALGVAKATGGERLKACGW